MMNDSSIGTIYRDLDTSDMYLLLGYTVRYHASRFVLVYLTQFYIGDNFIYNKYFNIDGYFAELKNNFINRPIVNPNICCSLRNFEEVDPEVYNFEPDLFKPDELKLWYTKSRLAGTIDYDVFFSLEDTQKEIEHLNLLKIAEDERNIELKLASVELLDADDIKIGNVYHNPVNEDNLLYFGKNPQGKYIVATLTDNDFKKLSTSDETKVYQTVLNLIKTKIRLYAELPKLEKESLLFVPLYTYESNMYYKLLLKKYSF